MEKARQISLVITTSDAAIGWNGARGITYLGLHHEVNLEPQGLAFLMAITLSKLVR